MTKIEKMRTRNILSIVFMVIVFIGALCVGVGLLLSEILFPQIEELFKCPIWYQVFLYLSFAIAISGIVGCAFTKNRQNTTKFEWNIELALFLGGFALEIFCALARTESYVLNVFICIGGAISSVGFFCGIGSLIGRLRKPKGFYADVYSNLITCGNLNYDNFPKSKPSSLSEIIEVEKFFETSLPAELIDFLLEFNGDGDLLFSTKEIIETTKGVRETFKDTTFIGVDSFCFFGGDGAGNYFCYKILDDCSIKDGEIYLWDHETNEAQLVETTLKDLIIKYYNGEMRKGD